MGTGVSVGGGVFVGSGVSVGVTASISTEGICCGSVAWAITAGASVAVGWGVLVGGGSGNTVGDGDGTAVATGISVGVGGTSAIVWVQAGNSNNIAIKIIQFFIDILSK